MQSGQPIAIEALSIELAAVRCGVSADYIVAHYDGDYVYLGRLKRILSTDLANWLDRQKVSDVSLPETSNPWEGKFSAKKGSVCTRESIDAA